MTDLKNVNKYYSLHVYRVLQESLKHLMINIFIIIIIIIIKRCKFFMQVFFRFRNQNILKKYRETSRKLVRLRNTLLKIQ